MKHFILVSTFAFVFAGCASNSNYAAKKGCKSGGCKTTKVAEKKCDTGCKTAKKMKKEGCKESCKTKKAS